LAFHSEAALLYCSEEFKIHITATSAASSLLANQRDLAILLTPAALIDWLKEQAGDPVS
jgi:hypothetical protein